MNKLNPFTELVIQYFENNLNKIERQEFESQLKNDKLLEKEFENQLVMNTILEDETLHRLKDNMDMIEKEIKQKKLAQKKRVFYTYSNSASMKLGS